MKNEFLKGESELEANTLSRNLDSLSLPAVCKCEKACAVWWEGALIYSASGVLYLSSSQPRMKSFGSPCQVDSLHIFLAPCYVILANRKRSNCSLSPAFLGKVLISTSQWEDHSSAEYECQALPFKFLYCDALLCDILRMKSMAITINATLFFSWGSLHSGWLINILNNGTLLTIRNQRKKLKLYIPF